MSASNLDFDRIISDMSRYLSTGNIRVEAFSARRRFPDLPEQLQARIVSRSRAQLEQMELLKPDIQEYEKLSVICQYHGLKPVEDEIFGRLANDVAWEIIDFQLNQVYRSQLVFRMGHYSLEEYETYSPWELFLRPRSIMSPLMEVTHLMTTAKTMMSLDQIPPYVIEEALSECRAQFKLTHEFVCPLEDLVTGQNRAFVSAFKVQEVPATQRVALIV